jgi:hypothetical protein
MATRYAAGVLEAEELAELIEKWEIKTGLTGRLNGRAGESGVQMLQQAE